jgi:hypothetical protein
MTKEKHHGRDTSIRNVTSKGRVKQGTQEPKNFIRGHMDQGRIVIAPSLWFLSHSCGWTIALWSLTREPLHGEEPRRMFLFITREHLNPLLIMGWTLIPDGTLASNASTSVGTEPLMGQFANLFWNWIMNPERGWNPYYKTLNGAEPLIPKPSHVTEPLIFSNSKWKWSFYFQALKPLFATLPLTVVNMDEGTI